MYTIQIEIWVLCFSFDFILLPIHLLRKGVPFDLFKYISLVKNYGFLC